MKLLFLFSCEIMLNSMTSWTIAWQAPLSTALSQSLLKFISIELVMLSNHLILCHPLLLPPSTFPASGSFQMSQLFTSGGQSIGASALASNEYLVHPMNIQNWIRLDWQVWSPCSRRDSQEYSPTPKFKNINPSVLSSVQSLSHVQLFATPWTRAPQASLIITNCRSLLKLMSIESMMPPNHLILCRRLLLLPSIFPSIRVFSSE